MSSKNATIDFLPERLNRQPVIFRGMTNSELFIMFGSGFVFGFVLGIAAAILVGEWALIPTLALLFAFVFVLSGGNVIARKKRGKPDTWFPRWIEMKFGRNRLLIPISETKRYWSIRRGTK
ncbi:TIGR03750 family conjugal transfer protein [Testudinibacter sp. P80/BLE/0925]|uniref:TIGR03750 family conjugal transfer protein n=1 Tax=Testudinibacter sp. TW-1 TaxID=3417757 RepID=UPI003D35C51F